MGAIYASVVKTLLENNDELFAHLITTPAFKTVTRDPSLSRYANIEILFYQADRIVRLA